MEISVKDLYAIIGEKDVDIRLLKQQVAELRQQVNATSPIIGEEKNESSD